MVAVVLSSHPAIGPACDAELRADGAEVTVVTSPSGLAGVLAGGTEVDVLVAVAPVTGSADSAGFAEVASEAMGLVVPSMVARGSGRIVFVVAATGLPGTSWTDGAGTAAWGVVGLARTAARELAASGITVNVVRTGLIDTGDQPVDAAVVADTPLKRAGTPADVAGAVAFLASDDAAYVTGTVLPVDGGLTMGQGA